MGLHSKVILITSNVRHKVLNIGKLDTHFWKVEDVFPTGALAPHSHLRIIRTTNLKFGFLFFFFHFVLCFYLLNFFFPFSPLYIVFVLNTVILSKHFISFQYINSELLAAKIKAEIKPGVRGAPVKTYVNVILYKWKT